MVKIKLRDDQKLAILSIVIVSLGIVTVVPFAFVQLVAEPQQLPCSIQIVNAVTATYEGSVLPWFVDGVPAYVIVPSTETDVFYGENCFTLISIEEFYEIYGSNATIPQLTFWMPEPTSGEYG
jgi:hypothetical protein